MAGILIVVQVAFTRSLDIDLPGPYGVTRLLHVWGLPRSTFYAQRAPDVTGVSSPRSVG